MNVRRLFHVFDLDVRRQLRRPMVVSLLFMCALLIWGLSTGSVKLATSGSSMVGGTKLWLTSEVSISQVLAVITSFFFAFFVAIAAGLASLREDELEVGELLRATPLKDSEYVWGKFLSLMVSFLVALAAVVGMMTFFFHGPGSVGRERFLGPFAWRNYLVPLAVFAVPNLVFVAGLSYGLGHWVRRAVVVFFFPIALGTTTFFLFWSYSPGWLDPKVNRLLLLLDPSGNRWIRETWFGVDRGADFYNALVVEYDAGFLVSRILVAALGLLAVGSCHSSWLKRRFSRLAFIGRAQVVPSKSAGRACPTRTEAEVRRLPGLLGGTLRVARVELRELRSSPGLYLFVPLVLIQTLGNALLATGFHDTPVLLTSGWLSVFEINFLTAMLCPLLLVYGVEAMERERSSGLAEIYFSTPLSTAAIIFGKAVGLLAAAAAVLAAVLAANYLAMELQGRVTSQIGPFLLTWGLLLLPTLLVWIAFVLAVRAITGSRLATYAVGFLAFGLTLYKQLVGEMTWVGNWILWSPVRWSDMGPFQLHRRPLVLNRLFVLCLGVLFMVIAARTLARRRRDAVTRAKGLKPLARPALALTVVALPALTVGAMLWHEVESGYQSEAVNEQLKDYWRKNQAAWKDRPGPAIAALDLDLELEPARRWYRVQGSYELVNPHDEELTQIALTPGWHWRHLRWTLNGRSFEPEDRAGLAVFRPSTPLGPDGRIEVGFAYEAFHPDGVSANGGNASEFVLPAGVVLDNFLSVFEGRPPTLVPYVGFRPNLGVDDDNRYEEPEYPDDYYEQTVQPGFSPRAFHTKIRVTGPADYTYNSVGEKVSDEVRDGRRTVVWESRHPVRLFNVVAGRWDVRRGRGTAIYHHPEHTYNLDEIAEALDGARHHYSDWFAPYPWSELKLSEFPNLTTRIGGTGFATNITFSEGAGFLTRSHPRRNAAFMVTAHEAAHQWWGNLLTPGDGPGGVLLAEGMSHFSTLLLYEEVKGPAARMEFAKRLEERYGKRRRLDMERPLVRLAMDRPGDLTLAYDKGAWVFWMLLEAMGRDAMLEGVRSFVEHWKDGPDYPLLEDFLASLRPFAPDPEAFDRLADMWFFDVVVPEYQLTNANRRPFPGGEWEATAEVVNHGTGSMSVDVAAEAGDQFDEDGLLSARYRDSRVTLVLAAGQSSRVVLRSDFKPERIVVDPDVKVLQLNRSGASVKLMQAPPEE